MVPDDNKPQHRTRREWEDLLRERLLKEQEHCVLFAAEFKRLSAIGRDAHNADGGLALRQAIVIQKAYYDRYLLALRQFNDLVIHGKAPADFQAD